VKRNVLLVTNSGNVSGRAGTEDQAETDRKENAIEILSLALHDIDLAIVDLGSSTQSLAIVETLSQRQPAPPVIALVEGHDPNAMSSLHQHGAAACLEKPFNADELARLIEAVCASTSHDNAPSCDKWGHDRASK
jgi:DNA-binding NarL/FixJ family response regulator